MGKVYIVSQYARLVLRARDEITAVSSLRNNYCIPALARLLTQRTYIEKLSVYVAVYPRAPSSELLVNSDALNK